MARAFVVQGRMDERAGGQTTEMKWEERDGMEGDAHNTGEGEQGRVRGE